MENLLVLSSYPEKGTIHAAKTVGGASYTKLLLTTLQKQHPDISLTVFAEAFDTKDAYRENNIQIQRLWKRNSFKSMFSLFQTLQKRKENNLLVSFEVYMFGSPAITFLALFSLLLLRIQGKQIFLMMHQVMGNFDELEANIFKSFFLNFSKNILYLFLFSLSERIIVFEEALKNQLGKSKKVFVIPHSISQGDIKNQQDARKRLQWDKNKKYILYFGYISPYKGVDALIKQWPDEENIQLIIAGGINPNYRQDKQMERFVSTIEKEAQEKNIIVTGFVPEEKVSTYFSAGDIVILPYKSFFSSSGPLALAIAYNKALLLSPALSLYAKTADFSFALQKARLTIQDICIPITTNELTNGITSILSKQKQMAVFAETLKKSRNIEKVAQEYYQILFS